MNWRKVGAYAAVLFAAQFAVGFTEGVLAPVSVSTFLASDLASFVACGSIFAHLTANQICKPFTHACLALALQIVVSVAFSKVLDVWLGEIPRSLIVFEWAVLICILLVGTAAGLSLRRSRGQPADA